MCTFCTQLAEKEYPELLPNLSSAKSPQQMLGPVVKEVWAPAHGLKVWAWRRGGGGYARAGRAGRSYLVCNRAHCFTGILLQSYMHDMCQAHTLAHHQPSQASNTK